MSKGRREHIQTPFIVYVVLSLVFLASKCKTNTNFTAKMWNLQTLGGGGGLYPPGAACMFVYSTWKKNALQTST